MPDIESEEAKALKTLLIKTALKGSRSKYWECKTAPERCCVLVMIGDAECDAVNAFLKNCVAQGLLSPSMAGRGVTSTIV